MANIMQQKFGTAAPASDSLAKGELAIRFVAANHTASSSSKLYFGEGDSANLRQFGFGITDGSTQSGVAIGENLTFTASGTASVSVSGQTVTIGASGASGNTFATDLKIGRDADNLIDFTTDNDIIFRANGQNAFKVEVDSSGHTRIGNITQDKDILFTGNDGGSTVTALSLDMSASGKATFNDAVVINDTLSVGSD